MTALKHSSRLLQSSFKHDERQHPLGSNTIFGDLGSDVIFSFDVADPVASPDTVSGGYGADTIFADDGDVVSGGAGTDRFFISGEFNSVDVLEEEAVVISDFDPATEHLQITDISGDLDSDGTYSFENDPDGTGVWVVLGTTKVVFLGGLIAADLSGANIEVLTAL